MDRVNTHASTLLNNVSTAASKRGQVRGRIGWSHRINDSSKSHWTYGGPLKLTNHKKYKEIATVFGDILRPGSYFELLYVDSSRGVGEPSLRAYRVDPVSGSRSIHQFDGNVWRMIRMQAGWHGRESWLESSVVDFYLPFDPARLSEPHPYAQIVVRRRRVEPNRHDCRFNLGMGDLLQLVCDKCISGKEEDYEIIGSPWSLRAPEEGCNHCAGTIDAEMVEVIMYGSQGEIVPYHV
ncbi:hypothetical protein FRC19_011557 [Serendipita sp. 401]|nr:hypothetical protein FRC15_003495 [Serendipita sp. 397]KAG8779961.1 hypothetical protein FRC16_003241 [Serendipita sp. 398]KAG8827856.1 hypothetical protein FRC19_011557 [Serendipita sp. 401]KAG8844855.1 hypothetical protein FRC20_003369 [Serendipita sp. 405]KAG9058206.1 hypothetical protein FS842_000147 [Serendipita sp. 407]